MGGCTNCKEKPGCDDRKGTMLSAVDEVLERLYPTRTWGDPDDLQRLGAGVSEEDALALADEMAAELSASTFFRPGGPDEYCNYVYVLCIGREPCLVQMRDGDVPIPDELDGLGAVSEQYLRVCLSDMAPMAAVQQTALEMEVEGDDLLLRETPRAGVYDAPLLKRFQRLVALLPAYGILHLDFGEISAPPPGFSAGRYGELYRGEPHCANYLFYPQPTTSPVTTVLSRQDRLATLEPV